MNRRWRRSVIGRSVLEPLEMRYLLAQSVWAYPGADGNLLYKPLPLGDKLQDFSNVGYKAGLQSIPDVPTRITVAPIAGDDQANIQSAINFVQGLTPDASGFRGAVLLEPGVYEIPGTLSITASGVVLRGSGQGLTTLLATGTQKDTTVNFDGSGGRSTVSNTTKTITDKYVPVGAISFTVSNTTNLAVGDSIMVHRPTTANWIHDIGMDQLTNPWTTRNVDMDRTITRIDGNVITIDAPITHALDQNYGGGTIWEYLANGRLANVGIEYISGESTFDPLDVESDGDHVDEEHAEHFIGMDGVINGWVRNVTSKYYGYSCVNMTGPSKWVTVQDSQCLDPVSLVTGGRRYSFNMGDSTNVLWKNLYTRDGRHDYVQGSEVTGPNVVVDSRADKARSDTGPHHRYSTGTLWDNVDVNGHSINIQNRWNSGSGHGWAGANQVVWNSEANNFTIQNIGFPNTAWNWAIGNVGNQQTGDFIAPDNTQVGSQGLYDSHGTKVDTRSLFHAQMAEKLAHENRVLREVRLGDADNYTAGDSADSATNAELAWRNAVQAASGLTPVGTDNVTNNQLVPLTFNFALDPGTRVVGASLSLGLKSAGNPTNGDVVFIENAGRTYTWADLGVPAPGLTAGAAVIDLSKLLAALQDGKLNIAVSGNTAIDWATLNFQTASTAQPTVTTVTPTDDAYVNQASPTSNFGDDASLFSKLNGATDNRESYLKFDLASLAGDVAGAYVRMVPTGVGVNATTFGTGEGAMFTRMSFVADDTWTEGALNWNNKPPSAPFFREFISYANEPLTFDVTALVRAAQAGDKKLSLRLNSIVDDDNSQITFASSENSNASFRPQLVIRSFTAVGAVADSTVRGGASANVNHGTQTDLGVKNDSSSSADNDREAYLRFDLTALPSSPANAVVRLAPFAVPATLTHTAQLVTVDTWSETAITWNNKPAATTSFGNWVPAPDAYSTFVVTSSAAQAYGSDKLLSMKVSSVTATTAAPVQYGSRENADLRLRPTLVSTNLKPLITDIPSVETAINTAVTGVWFGVWDAETPLGSLSLSASSSNPALLPVANITFGGSGADRTVSLTPAAGQSGSSNVTLTVTDAQGQAAQTVFQFVVDNVAAPINGDQDTPNQDDVIRIVRNGANVNIFRNAVLVIDQPFVTAPNYLINGLGGNDTLIVDLTGGNPIANGLTLDGGSGNDTVRLVGSGAAEAVTLTAGNVVVAGSGTFDYAAGETLELQLGLGADTLAVSGNSAVTAATLLLTLSGGGALAMAAGASLPDFTDVSVASATTFNLGGQNQTIDAIIGNGSVINTGAAAGTLTVGSLGSNSTFAGSLANGTQTLSITKVGAGTLTLTGTNTYSGTTTISGGVVEAASAASFAGLPGAVQFLGGTFRPTATQTAANVQNKWTTTFAGATGSNTGTFDIPAGVTLTLGAAGGPASWRTGGGTNAGGSFVKIGAGTLRVLTANPQQDDPIQLNAGTLVAEHADALGLDHSGVRVDLKSGATLVLKNDAGSNFRTPIKSVDSGGTINVVIDRAGPGAGVTHSLNALTSNGPFTLNVSAGANVTSGVAGLSLGSVTPGGSSAFEIGNGALATINGAIAGTFGLIKQGPGTLEVTRLPQGNAINIAAGLMRVRQSDESDAFVSRPSSLSLSPGATLDLTNNDLILDYSGGSPAAAIEALIASAYNVVGDWQGDGITSSVAAADGSYVLAVADNALLGSPFGSGGSGVLFGGVDVDLTTVLIKFTHRADVNLDGKVTPDDAAIFGSNYDESITSGFTWVLGDMNYDGACTLDDAAIFGTFYDESLPQM